MDNQLLDLERAVAKLKADVSIIENSIDHLKSKDTSIENKLDTSRNDLVEMKMNMHSDIGKVSQDVEFVKRDLSALYQDVSSLTSCTHIIEEKVDAISNNGFLSFTSDMDLKKTVTLIAVLISILTSPSLITSFFDDSQESDVRIEKLIQLLEQSNVSDN